MIVILDFKHVQRTRTSTAAVSFQNNGPACLWLHSWIPAVLIEILWNCQSELFSAGWVAAVMGGEGGSSAASHCSTPTTRVTFSLILTKVKRQGLNPKQRKPRTEKQRTLSATVRTRFCDNVILQHGTTQRRHSRGFADSAVSTLSARLPSFRLLPGTLLPQ